MIDLRTIGASARGLGRNASSSGNGDLIRQYVAFLCSAVPEDRRDSAIVSSVLPPTLADEHWAEGYISALIGASDDADLSAQIRAFRIPSIAARAAMHGAFNWRLKQAASAAGFRFLDALGFRQAKRACRSPLHFDFGWA